MSNNKYKILIADTDIKARKELSELLESNGYKVITAATAAEAVLMFKSYTPDIIISEFFLPDANGIFLIEKIKKESGVPIIILSDNGEEYNKVAALDAGADDYITKPFNILEVKARIKAIFRRNNRNVPEQENQKVIETKGLKIDVDSRRVYIDDKEVNLTAKEFELVYLLVSNPNKVYSREQLLKTIWGPSYPGDARTVDVHVRRLREKIEATPADPKYIHTKWGVGYYFHE